jgi:hypothetical protein
MSINPRSCRLVVPKARAALGLFGLIALTACEDTGAFNFQEVFGSKPETETVTDASGGEYIEQDVEAPEIFSANEPALWDGRPSLGGVWVAHPDVKEPERVMIRNQSNGKFVVGALFRRERETPGPRLQLSSDAAVALDVLAGAPVDVEVVAMRKERIEVTPPEPETVDALDAAVAAPAEIAENTLDPIEAAGAAIEAADPTPIEQATQTTAPAVESTLPVSRLEKPYIQVGIFNQAENAERVADQMRAAGVIPEVLNQESRGKPFWRVIVGPAATAEDRKVLQDKVVAQGYSDAYPVSN